MRTNRDKAEYGEWINRGVGEPASDCRTFGEENERGRGQGSEKRETVRKSSSSD